MKRFMALVVLASSLVVGGPSAPAHAAVDDPTACDYTPTRNSESGTYEMGLFRAGPIVHQEAVDGLRLECHFHLDWPDSPETGAIQGGGDTGPVGFFAFEWACCVAGQLHGRWLYACMIAVDVTTGRR